VFRHLQEDKNKIVVEQGGTRSGKTYNILMWIIFGYCYENTGKMVTIVRNSLPAVRGTVMRDFLHILKEYDLYNEELHRKTSHEYIVNGNVVEFLGLDQPQKVRGRKRNVLFCNEANEISYEGWQQLIFRTTERIIIDYNPSDEFHWIYDKVLTRNDCSFYKTTYLDNPFLEKVVIDEIERLRDLDENYWKVYGLGERGVSKTTVLTHWKEVTSIPDGWRLMNYGMDFGYTNDPTTVVAVYTDGEGFCLDEICYATGLTNYDISTVLRDGEVSTSIPIIADCAEPKSIQELCNFGYNVHPCRKGADSIRSGLDYLKSHPLLVTSRSVNGIKELRNYKYRLDKDGNALNQPVDRYNHFIDATRYAVTYNQTNPNFGNYVLG
jgi:phage terminase large subunit